MEPELDHRAPPGSPYSVDFPALSLEIGELRPETRSLSTGCSANRSASPGFVEAGRESAGKFPPFRGVLGGRLGGIQAKTRGSLAASPPSVLGSHPDDEDLVSSEIVGRPGPGVEIRRQ
jgi:hypothetical protein